MTNRQRSACTTRHSSWHVPYLGSAVVRAHIGKRQAGVVVAARSLHHQSVHTHADPSVSRTPPAEDRATGGASRTCWQNFAAFLRMALAVGRARRGAVASAGADAGLASRWSAYFSQHTARFTYAPTNTWWHGHPTSTEQASLYHNGNEWDNHRAARRGVAWMDAPR